MSRRAKIILTSLALLVLGGATFYGWLLWSTANPLRLRVVDVTKEQDGSTVVRFEVRNASMLTVKFMGAVATFSQPLRDPLASTPERVAIQAFPGSTQLLRPRETISGSIRTPDAVSCQVLYQWEAGMMGRVRTVEQWLERHLPRWLSRRIPTTYAVKDGETGQIPVPRPEIQSQ